MDPPTAQAEMTRADAAKVRHEASYESDTMDALRSDRRQLHGFSI